jgi:hypothetical protein
METAKQPKAALTQEQPKAALVLQQMREYHSETLGDIDDMDDQGEPLGARMGLVTKIVEKTDLVGIFYDPSMESRVGRFNVPPTVEESFDPNYNGEKLIVYPAIIKCITKRELSDLKLKKSQYAKRQEANLAMGAMPTPPPDDLIFVEMPSDTDVYLVEIDNGHGIVTTHHRHEFNLKDSLLATFK